MLSAQEDSRSSAENGSEKADSETFESSIGNVLTTVDVIDTACLEKVVALVQPALQLPQASPKRRGQGSRDRTISSIEVFERSFSP